MQWLKRDISSPEVVMPDEYLDLNLAERGLFDSIARATILFGSVPDNPRLVAKRIGSELAEVEPAWPAVRALLQPDESGNLVHAEIMAAVRAAEDAYQKGKQQRINAANARWDRGRNADSCGVHAGRMREDAEPMQIEIEIKSKKKEISCSTDVERDGVIDISTVQSKRPKPDEIADWFDSQFWPAYPRKQGKQPALKAARAHLKSTSAREEALAGLERQLPDLRSRDQKFVPLPASWINGRRWEDEALGERSNEALEGFNWAEEKEAC